MQVFASRYTYQTLGTTLTVLSGVPVKVFGVVIHNAVAAASIVYLKDADGNIFAKFSLAQDTSFYFNTPFLADKGLTVVADTPSASIAATVFHSQASS
jgi:hypothetical protein